VDYLCEIQTFLNKSMLKTKHKT